MSFVRHMKSIVLLLVFFLSPPIWASETVLNCKQPTLEETLHCLSSEYKLANKELQGVLAVIKAERADDELFILGFNKAQSDWEASFKSNCDSIYNLWRQGSVKNIKWLECKIELTNQRTAFLNKNYGSSAEAS